MFGSQILEVAIGLILVFLLVSLILTAVRESIEAIAKTRARDLERAIAELLKDPEGSGLRRELYTHPLVFSLFPGGLAATRFDAAGKVLERAARNVPSYIPREVFSAALQDILKGELAKEAEAGAADYAKAAKAGDVRTQGSVHLLQAYKALLQVSGGDAERARKGIEQWYDASMDRASGWFKRRTQKILFLLGFGVAVLLNINAIDIAQYLATNQAAREGMVALAGQIDREHEAARAKAKSETAAPKPEASPASGNEQQGVTDNEATAAVPDENVAEANEASTPGAEAAATNEASDANQADAIGNGSAATDDGTGREEDAARIAESMGRRVQAVGLPVGWDEVQLARIEGEWKHNPVWTLLSLLIGWLMVGFAATLGAPFWFDLLGKFMVVRSTVKPTEKSPDEASKDGGTGGSPKSKPDDEDDDGGGDGGDGKDGGDKDKEG
jgi:hypothetical protein